MNKKRFLRVVVISAVVIIAVAILRGSEDRWVCDGGQWVRHGVPSAPMPTEPCGEAKTEPMLFSGALDIAQKNQECSNTGILTDKIVSDNFQNVLYYIAW